jgi:hypothetical protein
MAHTPSLYGSSNFAVRSIAMPHHARLENLTGKASDVQANCTVLLLLQALIFECYSSTCAARCRRHVRRSRASYARRLSVGSANPICSRRVDSQEQVLIPRECRSMLGLAICICAIYTQGPTMSTSCSLVVSPVSVGAALKLAYPHSLSTTLLHIV